MKIGARIREVLMDKGVKQKQFAEKINEDLHTVNKIVVGKRPPSVAFIVKFLKEFPDIDTDWLLFGNKNQEVAEEGVLYKKSYEAEKIVTELENKLKELKKVLTQK